MGDLIKQRLDELSTEVLKKYHQKAFNDFNDRSPEAKSRMGKRLRGLNLVSKALDKKKYSGMYDYESGGGVRRSVVENHDYSSWRDWNDDYVKLLKKRNKIEKDHDKVTRYTAHLDDNKAMKLKAKLDQANRDIEAHHKKTKPEGYTLSNLVKR